MIQNIDYTEILLYTFFLYLFIRMFLFIVGVDL